MAADPTAFKVMRGSDIITNSCLFFGNDKVTQLDGDYLDGYFWPSYFNFVETIYVEYEGIKYGWSNYNFGFLNSADLSELDGPAILDRVELPDGSQALIQDHRIDGYAGSPTPGGVANKTSSIPYGEVDSTSTATVFTATVDGITELRDGVCVLLKNGVVTSASGFTININGLGAKPCFSNLTAATRDTTIFNINYTMLFIYDSTRVVDSITGAWCCYRGYDANTNTIGYQVRTNSYSLPMSSITYRYRLLFTSADGTHFVPANNSTSTNATASRTVCQEKIDPFGKIVYYGTTASVAAESRPAVANLWLIYTVTLGYSFNRTGAALTLTSWKPIYLKCAPQADGSAIIDSTTPYVQDLPSTEDGKIYIFLGVAYSATAIELLPNHPVYCYKDGAVRQWTNAASGASSLSSLSDVSVPSPAQGEVLTYVSAEQKWKSSPLMTTTVPNVTSVGTASTWAFSVGGSDGHTLIITGGNGTAPTLGNAKTVVNGVIPPEP